MFLDNTIVHSFQIKGSVLCRQNCQVCFLEQFSMQEKPSNTSHISDHLNSISAVLKMSTDQTFKTTLRHQILTCYINVFCSRAHKHAINSFRTVVFAHTLNCSFQVASLFYEIKRKINTAQPYVLENTGPRTKKLNFLAKRKLALFLFIVLLFV